MIAALFSVLSPLPFVVGFTEVNRPGYKYHLDMHGQTRSLRFEGTKTARLLVVKCF